MSTYKASKNLGLEPFFINITNNTWSLEFEDAKIMDSSNVEHIKDAARVISEYCDIIGVRSFPLLKSKENVPKTSFSIRFHLYPGVSAVSTMGGNSVLIQINKNSHLL
mgnify:CR=1 FL=1